jgi:hypothetical protein
MGLDSVDLKVFFETLRLIRKGSADDFELLASYDEKIWGVRIFIDYPAKHTYVIHR